MYILITGASGFIGSHLLKCAEKKFHTNDVHLILLSSHEISGYTYLLHNNYTYNINDFKDKGIDKIDAVIHLGWFVSKAHSDEQIGTNNTAALLNTKHLLENLPSIPKHIVYCSSVDVYGDGSNDIYDITEESDLAPKSAYSSAKLLGEMLVKEWALKNGVVPHILRLGHIYGPGDKRRYFLTVFIKNVADREKIVLSADPGMFRNLLYVDDCCNFILNSLSLSNDVGPINLVSKNNFTMLEIVKTIISVGGSKTRYEISKQSINTTRKGISFKNSNKCREYLGEEKVSLKVGILNEYRYLQSANCK